MQPAWPLHLSLLFLVCDGAGLLDQNAAVLDFYSATKPASLAPGPSPVLWPSVWRVSGFVGGAVGIGTPRKCCEFMRVIIEDL